MEAVQSASGSLRCHHLELYMSSHLDIPQITDKCPCEWFPRSLLLAGEINNNPKTGDLLYMATLLQRKQEYAHIFFYFVQEQGIKKAAFSQESELNLIHFQTLVLVTLYNSLHCSYVISWFSHLI